MVPLLLWATPIPIWLKLPSKFSRCTLLFIQPSTTCFALILPYATFSPAIFTGPVFDSILLTLVLKPLWPNGTLFEAIFFECWSACSDAAEFICNADNFFEFRYWFTSERISVFIVDIEMLPPDELLLDFELAVEGLLCLLQAILSKRKRNRIKIFIEINIDINSIFIPSYWERMLNLENT